MSSEGLTEERAHQNDEYGRDTKSDIPVIVVARVALPCSIF